MKSRQGALVAVVLGLAMSAATKSEAGAWTLKKHHWQTISGATLSQASIMFGSDGRASRPTKFGKSLLQNSLEYGLTDHLTLFATPAVVMANVQEPGTRPVAARDTSVEAGARYLAFDSFGIFSIQASYKAAGAFDLSVSNNQQPGRQIDVRLLYGTGFTLFGMNGFADIQAGQRWLNRPRPDETPVDLTAGLWLTPRTMLMAQSLNIISSGDAIAPYSYYRSHKIGLSVVQKVWKRWSVQFGAFVSPSGQNALVERGVGISLWTQN